MQLTQPQCDGLDEMMLERGLVPSSVHDGSRELREASPFAAFIAIIHARGGSSTFPHIVDPFTGEGRSVAILPFDQEEDS